MSKLFENISSIDRRQLINEYNNNRSKKIINKTKNNSINNYNKNINTNQKRKNYSLLNKYRDSNNSNINNISNNRNIARNYISTDNNNFDNNFLSSRPKTPIYGVINKSSGNNFQNNLNNRRTIVNNNTNKLAHKHFMRIQKMMNDYNNKYKANFNNKEINSDCFDRNNKMNQNKKIINYKAAKNSNKSIFSNENKKFSSINDCTFNNYLKSLN